MCSTSVIRLMAVIRTTSATWLLRYCQQVETNSGYNRLAHGISCMDELMNFYSTRDHACMLAGEQRKRRRNRYRAVDGDAHQAMHACVPTIEDGSSMHLWTQSRIRHQHQIGQSAASFAMLASKPTGQFMSLATYVRHATTNHGRQACMQATLYMHGPWPMGVIPTLACPRALCMCRQLE